MTLHDMSIELLDREEQPVLKAKAELYCFANTSFNVRIMFRIGRYVCNESADSTSNVTSNMIRIDM